MEKILEKTPMITQQEPVKYISKLPPVNTTFSTGLDIIPTSRRSVRLFLHKAHMAKGSVARGEMRVWDLELQPSEDGTQNVGTWTCRTIFDANFTEPFRAFQHLGTFFFVTRSGRVYAAKRPETGLRKTELVWNDKEYKVIALLRDLEHDRTFAFGKTVYFELKDTIDFRHCPDITGGDPKTPEPLRTVLECRRALEKDKVLVWKAAPPTP